MGVANRKPIESSTAMTRPPAISKDQPGAESLGPVLVAPEQAVPARKKTGMRQAVAEARREVAASLPGVVRELARQALEGSVNHLKLYLELSGVLKGGLAAPARQAREQTLEEFLNERWAQDKAIDEADQAQAHAQAQAQAQARAQAQLERDRARAEEVLSGL